MTAISLPITDRQRAHDFYADAFDLSAVGPLGPDGLPEPLRFDHAGTQLLFIPTGGFDWALGDRTLAERPAVGCMVTHGVGTDDEVDETTARAAAAGGAVVLAPTRQPWGMYAATVADPDGNLWMITSSELPDADPT